MILETPLSEKDVRSLKLGDTVYLSGSIITGRDKMHMRAANAEDDASKMIRGSVIFHCGPIITGTEGNWKIIAAGPTTSARMNSTQPEVIRRYGVRAVIGKGGMSSEVCEAMKETGCVYLAATGGAAVSIAECLDAEGVEWSDLGMAEAMWKLRANRLGPLIVAMDADGNSLYENVGRSLRR